MQSGKQVVGLAVNALFFVVDEACGCAAIKERKLHIRTWIMIALYNCCYSLLVFFFAFVAVVTFNVNCNLTETVFARSFHDKNMKETKKHSIKPIIWLVIIGRRTAGRKKIMPNVANQMKRKAMIFYYYYLCLIYAHLYQCFIPVFFFIFWFLSRAFFFIPFLSFGLRLSGLACMPQHIHLYVKLFACAFCFDTIFSNTSTVTMFVCVVT